MMMLYGSLPPCAGGCPSGERPNRESGPGGRTSRGHLPTGPVNGAGVPVCDGDATLALIEGAVHYHQRRQAAPAVDGQAGKVQQSHSLARGDHELSLGELPLMCAEGRLARGASVMLRRDRRTSESKSARTSLR